MATLYVENIPDDLYEALRKRARGKRNSIAAEIISLLQDNVLTDEQLERRRKAIRALSRLREQPSPRPGPFPSTEEMLREDRGR